MKEISQGKGVEKDKRFLQDQKTDPIGIVSNSVWRGIGIIGIYALILFPAVYFYELLPEAIRQIATPNTLLIFGVIICAFVYITVSKIIGYLGKGESE